MLIDIHAHYIPPEVLRERSLGETWRPRVYRDEQGRQMIEHGGAVLSSAPRDISDIDCVLAEQKTAQVDVVALSPWSSLFHYDQDAVECLRTCRLQNEAIARRVGEHAGHLAGFGIVPLQDANLAAKAVGPIVRELHLNGIEIGTNVNSKYLGDESFLPFWEAVADLDTFIFIHPVAGIGGPLMRQYELGNLFGNPSETALTAASLIFGGVLERFPLLKICLAHGGGTLPYVIGRFDRGWQVRPAAKNAKITRPPSFYLKQFYFDTITFSVDALRYLIRVVGVDHILLGTDYPFDMGYDRPREMVDALGLPQEQAEAICFRTAARLLKINL